MRDRVLSYNRRFIDTWGIPADLQAAGNEVALRRHIAPQLVDPEPVRRSRAGDQVADDGHEPRRVTARRRPHPRPVLGADGWRRREVPRPRVVLPRRDGPQASRDVSRDVPRDPGRDQRARRSPRGDRTRRFDHPPRDRRGRGWSPSAGRRRLSLLHTRGVLAGLPTHGELDRCAGPERRRLHRPRWPGPPRVHVRTGDLGPDRSGQSIVHARRQRLDERFVSLPRGEPGGRPAISPPGTSASIRDIRRLPSCLFGERAASQACSS